MNLHVKIEAIYLVKENLRVVLGGRPHTFGIQSKIKDMVDGLLQVAICKTTYTVQIQFRFSVKLIATVQESRNTNSDHSIH